MASEYDPDDELAQWAGGYFNGEGCISFSTTQLESFNIDYQLGYRVSISASTPEVAGLFDGEGWISFSAHENNSGFDYNFNKCMAIKMSTLNDIERFAVWMDSVGVEPSVSHRPRKEEWNDLWTVKCQSLSGIRTLLEELQPYLSKSKFIQSYITLEEVFPRMEKGSHLERRGYLECMSWLELMREYKGNQGKSHTFQKFDEEVWPDVEPRESHLAPSKEKFEEQLFGDKERETFEEKTGPSPRQPDKDWDGENDPFAI